MRRIQMKENENISIHVMKQEDNLLHDHSFFELVYVTNGTAEHILNGKRSRLQKGDFFFLDYGSYHGYKKCNDFTLINCLFLPEFINETLQGCHSMQELLHICMLRYYRFLSGVNCADHIYHDEDGSIGCLLQNMLQEHENAQLGSQELLRFKLTEIIIKTLRKLLTGSGKYQYSDTVRAVLKYIDKHYAKAAALQHFCDTEHYSLSYISRRFKQETGLSYMEYLQKVRVEKACELLRAEELSISEVAHQVGYEDVQFFYTVFKRILNMTPKEYRKLT